MCVSSLPALICVLEGVGGPLLVKAVWLHSANLKRFTVGYIKEGGGGRWGDREAVVVFIWD